MIDMRSDTVTKPTLDMRQSMFDADVGDDVMGDDPTVNALQQRLAVMFDKEDALFFPTGTMCNLTAIMCWCTARGSEMIVGDNSHMFLFEQAGAAQFGGVSPRTVPNLPDGTMDVKSVELAIRDDDIHEPVTKLIGIENTHNACGGRVLPIVFLENLRTLSNKHKIPIHLDGARLWNSITAMNMKPSFISPYVDSISVCLSKGLGAPAGSVLISTKEIIAKARRIRKALGGGMRQVGVLAAAGNVVLNDFEAGILTHDHRRTMVLANAIHNGAMEAFTIDLSKVETNIIFLSINCWDPSWDESSVSTNIKSLMKNRGLLVSAWAPLLIRLVVHRDIDDNDIAPAIRVLKDVSDILVKFK